jgi:hypothetical protein
VVLLTSHRGNQIPPGNAGEINGTVDGQPAIISERRFPSATGALEFSMAFYLLPQGGLLHSLNVRLDQGLTRTMADQIAASVR